MNERRNRRWPGFALLGILAVVCLLSNALIWWLVRQPMAVQPRGFSFVIDVQLIRQAVWGIVFIQPAILSVYLAYGKHSSLIRMVVTVVAFLVVYAASMVGWRLSNNALGGVFSTPHAVFEIMLLCGAQVISLSLAMWASRIMRGWRLSRDAETVETDERLISRRETVFETVVLILISIAAIFWPDWLAGSGIPSGIGALYFAILGLVGTFVVAPIVFVSLRFRYFAVIGPALLMLLFAVPAALFGFFYGISMLSGDTIGFDYLGPLSSAFFAALMLAAVLASIRLAGYRLQQRPFEKKLIVKAPVDPFSD
ncbi:hypothetical protein N9L06_03095 [Mariniblastus sp.]|nr:hypothetical protein [Mariniblastus sp.]